MRVDQTKNGQMLWIRNRCKPIPGSGGEEEGLDRHINSRYSKAIQSIQNGLWKQKTYMTCYKGKNSTHANMFDNC